MSFARSLATELAWFAERTGGRQVTSIFFGGGTPSLMPPEAVGHVLDAIGRLWSLAPDLETTMEANPTSIEAENFRGYRAAGEELRMALGEQQGHMSLYQLTIEPGTAYFDLYAKGNLAVPADDRAADLYDVTQELTEAAGLPAYEVSNHAAPGQESRHNLLYWRYGEYAGAGPGAHSRIDSGARRLALVAERHPETWRDLVESQGHGIVTEAEVPPEDQASEYLLMGLRIAEGIDLTRYAALAGREIDSSKIAGLKSMGLIKREGNRLRATPDGRKLLNALIAELAV